MGTSCWGDRAPSATGDHKGRPYGVVSCAEC